jgi:hypothetical protein
MHGDKALAFRLHGSFVQTDPREWKEEFDMTVNVGLGVADPQQQLLMLQSIEQSQAMAVQSGGLGKIVTLDNLYNVQSKKAELAGYKDPTFAWQDPKNAPPAGPPPPSEAEIKAQADLQKTQLQIKADGDKAQATMVADAHKTRATLDADRALQSEKIASEERLAMFKIESENATRIQIAQIQAAATIQGKAEVNVDAGGAMTDAADKLQQQLLEQGNVIATALQAFAQSQEQMQATMRRLAAPKRILRDPATGRANGVEAIEDEEA